MNTLVMVGAAALLFAAFGWSCQAGADAAEKGIPASAVDAAAPAKAFRRPIGTKVEPLDAFYPAEDYHQDFLVRNPSYPYIVINDLPKVGALERTFPQLYRDKPVTLSTP